MQQAIHNFVGKNCFRVQSNTVVTLTPSYLLVTFQPEP